MQKEIKKLKAKSRTLKRIIVPACATILSVPALTNAEDKKGTASGLVNSLLSYIFTIFFWIGVLLFTWGVGQMVLAFKNEDADSKSRAMMLIVVSIILTAIGTIVNGVFSGHGVSAVSTATI